MEKFRFDEGLIKLLTVNRVSAFMLIPVTFFQYVNDIFLTTFYAQFRIINVYFERM